MNSDRMLLKRVFLDTRTNSEVEVRLTAPILLSGDGEPENWLCYLHVIGLDGGGCRAVEQVSEFDVIISAAELLYRIIAPHERFLETRECKGFSGFPRILPVITSEEAHTKIDELLKSSSPRKIAWRRKGR